MSSRSLLALALVACSSKSDPSAQPTKGSATPGSAAVPVANDAAAVTPDDRYRSESLGALTFSLSEGTPVAREHFARGLLALHSFWYDEAQREFGAALAADPTMDMAAWGIAMSHIKLLWGDDDTGAAKEALTWMRDPDALTEREQAWILAGIELLEPKDVPTSRKRFAAAMEDLHTRFPDDESTTFLAIALLSTTRPEDPDHIAVRMRAGELAKSVFAKNPKHPGAAHYAIHAFDTPDLAAQALPFAREYAAIAPEAFHARHMPAHIFVRLGMWTEAIASCHAAWDASLAAAQRLKLSANHHDFHSLNWLVEMPFELGRKSDAEAALKTFADAVRGGLNRQQRTLYATQVASFMMRSGEWTRVDELLAPLDAAPLDDDDPQAKRAGDAGSHCAPQASPHADFERIAVLETRARAAAMQRDVAKTKRFLDEATAVRAKTQAFVATQQSKESIARIDAEVKRRHRALLARASKNDRVLLEVLRESATESHVDAAGETNPSGSFVSEEIAETLLRMKRGPEAVAAYAAALKIQPNRARCLLGAARAATLIGDAPRAKEAYQQLLAQWSAADADTDGLAEARAAVAK